MSVKIPEKIRSVKFQLQHASTRYLVRRDEVISRHQSTVLRFT